MANDENTAVNDLIAQVGGGPLQPAVQKSSLRVSPVGINNETLPASPPAMALGWAPTPVPDPGASVFDDDPPVVVGSPAWSHEAQRRIDHGEHLIGTLRVSRKSNAPRVAGRAVPMVLVALGGVVVGAFLALRGPSMSPSTLPAVTDVSASPVAPPAAAIVTPAPAAPSWATAALTPPPAVPAPAKPIPTSAPALIDVRIDSIPSGATVMIADRGKTQLVGNTPIAVAIDPTRDYDLVVSYAGKPTKTEHLDPRITQHITVTLDAAAPPSPPPAPRGEPAPVAVRRTPAEARIREPRAASARGHGTLMISSKPPCEIVIDGKPTGLTTPQRAIALSAGRHKVTLVNGDKDIKRTFSVQITVNATEKLIEDLMR